MFISIGSISFSLLFSHLPQSVFLRIYSPFLSHRADFKFKNILSKFHRTGGGEALLDGPDSIAGDGLQLADEVPQDRLLVILHEVASHIEGRGGADCHRDIDEVVCLVAEELLGLRAERLEHLQEDVRLHVALEDVSDVGGADVAEEADELRLIGLEALEVAFEGIVVLRCRGGSELISGLDDGFVGRQRGDRLRRDGLLPGLDWLVPDGDNLLLLDECGFDRLLDRVLLLRLLRLVLTLAALALRRPGLDLLSDLLVLVELFDVRALNIESDRLWRRLFIVLQQDGAVARPVGLLIRLGRLLRLVRQLFDHRSVV